MPLVQRCSLRRELRSSKQPQNSNSGSSNSRIRTLVVRSKKTHMPTRTSVNIDECWLRLDRPPLKRRQSFKTSI